MDAALRMLNAGDWNGGLAALNALWAETRCPKLAAQIERLSAHALASRPPLQGKKKALQTAWEQACAEGSLVGLERLLEVIGEGTAAELRGRFDRLGERAPDPRMTMVVPLFAGELHLRSDSARAVWNAFFKLVVHTGDPRARKPLEKLAALAQATIDKSRQPRWEKFEQYLLKQVPKVVDKLPSAGKLGGVAALKTAVAALVKAPFKEAAPAASSVDRIFDKVLEQPGEEGAIQVWSDALLEAGDDRGTFAMLQLTAEQRALTAKEAKLERQLLKANRLKWLGQAGAVIEANSATFRRGLLDSALLKRKARPKHLEAPEFRTLAQLWAPSVELVAHDNLLSLTRLGRCAVPNPRSTTGPVGFDHFEGALWDWEEARELAGLDLARRITHLELELPEDLDVAKVLGAFPKLQTVMVAYSWWVDAKKQSIFEPLLKLLRRVDTVIFEDIMDSRKADDGFFVDRLPKSNVHFVYGGGEVYRSYLRQGRQLHAVLTDTSTKAGFCNDCLSGADQKRWLGARMFFFSRMPAVEALSFRQRSTWKPEDVEAVAERTKHLKNVTLPRAKKAR